MKNIFSHILCTLFIVSLLILAGCSPQDTAKAAVKVTFSGPAGMTMSFNGKALPGLVRTIRPGRYILKFSAPGYKTVWQNCTISAGDNNSVININMEPEKSVIYISCTVDDSGRDANVAWTLNDGERQGVTPCLITGIPLGTHSIEFNHPGYSKQTRKITVSSPRPLPAIKERLSSTSGTLQVVGKPDGAILYINDKPAGPTPFQAKYTAGKYLLELRAPGYLSRKAEIEVIANKTVKSNLTLSPEPSSLFIETDPPNAVCVIRGDKKGTTPIKVANLQPGNYKIELSLPGFDTVTEIVEVKAGSHEKIKVTMESGLGQARLNIRPAGVDVLVDGKSFGRTVKTAGSSNDVQPIVLNDLTPGEHVCIISHPMAKPHAQKTFKFTVNKNKVTECPPFELWVPNCEITYRRNIKEIVKLIRLTEDEVEFELHPGISVTERRSNVQIRHLPSR